MMRGTARPTGRRPLLGGKFLMQRVLIPVDGSSHAAAAVRHVLARLQRGAATEIHLLNVQPPLSRRMARFIPQGSLREWRAEQAELALGPARRLLDQAGVPHTEHRACGGRAEQIVSEATRLKSDVIVMHASRSALARALGGSTAFKVLEQTSTPVELVGGARRGLLEKWGLPASLGALLGLVLIAD